MNRRGEKRVVRPRRRRMGEIVFFYLNNKLINNFDQLIIVIYIWKIDGKGYIC